MVESLVLTTEGGSISNYGSLYKSLSDVSQVRSRAHARIAAHRFERMLVFDRYSDGLAHHSNPYRAKKDGTDHLSIHYLRSGGLAGGPFGEQRNLKSGQVLFFDSSQPIWSRTSKAHYVTIWIARDRVPSRLRDLRGLSGSVLSADASGLLGDFMKSLSRRAATLPDSVAVGASRTMGEMIASALSGLPMTTGRAVPNEVATMMRQDRIEAFIMSRLNDPTLDIEQIGAGTGLSRASVYRAFKEIGGVAEFIQTQRLQAIRDALRRARETRSFSALAYAHGFASESHCSRLFKQMFRTSPGRFRTEVQNARSSQSSSTSETGMLSHWINELY